jgi:prevent-host-death family protein
MERTEKIETSGVFSIKEARVKFTEINRDVAKKGSIVILTNRGTPSTAIVSMKLLRKLIGDKAFKELLFKQFYLKKVEDSINNFLDSNEETISLDELKKKLGR